MKIVLTSFRDAHNWKGISCSIARWQPSWSSMPEFPVDVKPVLDGRKLGDWISPAEYKKQYEKLLKRREQQLIDFLCRIESDEPLILCCWCNLDRPNKWDKNKLYCHRILLGWWIEENFQYARVIYADGAERPIWEKTKK